MQTSDQKSTNGLGRRMRNRAQVIRILNASASSRKSSQWLSDVVERKRKDEGKTLEKPIDESAFAVMGR